MSPHTISLLWYAMGAAWIGVTLLGLVTRRERVAITGVALLCTMFWFASQY